ncbi:hypothetical protein KEM52_004064, partial [Ascosphaera acerosa]
MACLSEWFGASNFFSHPSAAPNSELRELFPGIITADDRAAQQVMPSSTGENIAQLHDRLAVALKAVIDEADAEIAAFEAANPAEQGKPRSIWLCSHAAPIIAMGRALTGNMPEDTSEHDFDP